MIVGAIFEDLIIWHWKIMKGKKELMIRCCSAQYFVLFQCLQFADAVIVAGATATVRMVEELISRR